MSRTAVYSALILRSRASGESNRDVWLLTAGAGIIRATVFGGPKSRLRAHAAPFHSGQVWVYHDPVKDSRKLTDFDVHSWRPGLRELYERTTAAAATAQTILETHGGGGNWSGALALAESTLDAMESAHEELCGRILIYFFWQWAGFLGLQPRFDFCVSCGNTADTDSPLWYSVREGGVLCERCASKEGSAGGVRLLLSPGCRRWRSEVGPHAPSQLDSFTMDNKTLNDAKALTHAILTEALGRRLASWDW
jgi:DNA repair protein RecO (recombination protein O)